MSKILSPLPLLSLLSCTTNTDPEVAPEPEKEVTQEEVEKKLDEILKRFE